MIHLIDTHYLNYDLPTGRQVLNDWFDDYDWASPQPPGMLRDRLSPVEREAKLPTF